MVFSVPGLVGLCTGIKRGRSVIEMTSRHVECRYPRSCHRRGSTSSSQTQSSNHCRDPSNKGSSSPPHNNPEFRWSQVWLQWSLGIIVSTPIIAILQGSFLLNDYRARYSDAPRPAMPARGVAVAIDDDPERSSSSWIRRGGNSNRLLPWSQKQQQQQQRPLRLLVVGDSLAAGVGISKSGVPILPESIARALSKALDGRPVYWTCVGTPGVSASQLVQDIYRIDETMETEQRANNTASSTASDGRARQLERLVKEFYARRRRWQERRRRLDEIKKSEQDTTTTTPGDVNESKVDEKKVTRPNVLMQWWRQIRQKESPQPAEIRETTVRVVAEWWTNIRQTLRKRREQVEEDLSVIKEIVKLEPMVDNYDDDTYHFDFYRENELEEDEIHDDDIHVSQKSADRLPLLRKGSVFRRSSINPSAAAEYDIAVVLTGLNDVKEAFMPHMTRGANSSIEEGGVRVVGGLKNQLYQVLKALRDKMGRMDLEENDEDASTGLRRTADEKLNPSSDALNGPSTSPTDLKRPMVVVPELPVAPLQIFRLVPLKWFLVPIFRGMENNKRFIAHLFPDYVIFVPQPDLQWWTDTEAGIGPVRENIKQEQLLLRVTDIAHTARDRIQDLMKKYYDAKEEENASSAPRNSNYKDNPYGPGSEMATMENERLIQVIDDDHHRPEQHNKNAPGQVPSDLVSVDRMHPNDEGYELWGRHIAAAIIQEWKRSSEGPFQ